MPVSTQSLLEARSGRATVASLDLADGATRRLVELGVRVGATIEVLRRTSGGGVVIGVAGSRVALDRASARRVCVVPEAASA